MLQKEAGHGLQSLAGTITSVRPSTAVNVHIHKPGDNGIPRTIHRQVGLLPRQVLAHLHDGTLLNLYVSLDQLKILVQVGRMDQKHLYILPFPPETGQT